MNRFLIIKLLSVTLVTAAFIIVFIWFSIDTLVSGYVKTVVGKYSISADVALEMYEKKLHGYLLCAFFGALAVTVALSYFIMKLVLTPIKCMIRISGEIAEGNFTGRVPELTNDEVGDLARSFNQMTQGLNNFESMHKNLMLDAIHEMRIPLNGIHGCLEILNGNIAPAALKTLSSLKNETVRLSELVEDVFQLASAEAVRGNLELTELDLQQAVNDALKDFIPLFWEKDIIIRVDTPKGDIFAFAEQRALARIFRNLLSNAVIFAPEQTEVDIRITAEKGKAKVTFCNIASKLTDEDMPFVFESFYRGKNLRQCDHRGAGIGLAIVKQLAEAQNGTATAELVDRLIFTNVFLPLKKIAYA
ncbi:MAG: HAMP domain-containing histidine kinase [Desulfobacteraceae bacterium]|nr:HAMP domain-containing histidine kinase [Desulfobacteraceae bacterium]